jgi:spermidine synthase
MFRYSVLRNPTPDQIDQITALYRSECWWSKEADDPEQVKGIVAGSHFFMIVQKGDEIIGMGRALSDRRSDSYIQDMTVKREYRRQGIGSTIVTKLVDLLRQDGIEWVGLIAERGSQEFYARLGFQIMPNAAPMLRRFE